MKSLIISFCGILYAVWSTRAVSASEIEHLVHRILHLKANSPLVSDEVLVDSEGMEFSQEHKKTTPRSQIKIKYSTVLHFCPVCSIYPCADEILGIYVSYSVFPKVALSLTSVVFSL